METAKADEMTRFFFHHYFQHRYELVAPNIHMRQGYEIDIFAIRKSGFADEIEIKTNRSDFLADFKKTVTVHNGWRTDATFGGSPLPKWRVAKKHEALINGQLSANYFSFLMPEDVADRCNREIPEYAGIYTLKPNQIWSVREIRKPKRLHNDKISDQLRIEILKKMAGRYIEGLLKSNGQ